MLSVEELEMEIMVRRDIMKIEKSLELEKDFIPDNVLHSVSQIQLRLRLRPRRSAGA